MTGDAAPPPEPVRAPAEADPRPVVALPRQGLPGGIIAAAAILLALLLFSVLNARRQRAAGEAARPDRAQISAFAPPPPLVIPPEPGPLTLRAPGPDDGEPAGSTARSTNVPAAPAYARPFLPAAPRATPDPGLPPPAAGSGSVPWASLLNQSSGRASPGAEAPPRFGGSALVIDGPGDQGGAQGAGGLGAVGGAARGGPGAGGDDAPARATLIGDRGATVPVGTVIPAVLETPIDTARPGLLRAVVSEDTRGFDGRRVLVPRGSRLIGEYQADVRENQRRVLVTWNRLIRPDGVAIRLGSPASDPLGGAGVPGRLHTYFLRRFASAVLQSALTVGVNYASRPRGGSVIVGLPGTTVNNAVGQGGLTSGNPPQPKITVKQGAALTVFVARDLDFSGVPSRP